MIDVAVRFEERDATIKYLPGNVSLDQILKRYDNTPFGVTPEGPVVSIARTDHVTVRGWIEREDGGAALPDEAGDAPSAPETGASPSKPIWLSMELVPSGHHPVEMLPEFKFVEPPAPGLIALEAFAVSPRADTSPDDPPGVVRYVATLAETVVLSPGELIVPVSFALTAKSETDALEKTTGTLDVVLRTTRADRAATAATGVALVDGALELRLGHLCTQTGCLEHFHKSLAGVAGLGAVRPLADLTDPRAVVYLRDGQAVDLWNMRETLRDQSVEIAGMLPQELSGFRLRVEFPRWLDVAVSGEIRQCVACRDRLAAAVDRLPWTREVEVSGGGLNVTPADASVDLVSLLDLLGENGAAPAAVWLVPAGVPMPKVAPALAVSTGSPSPKTGSHAHPLIELELAHACDLASDYSALLAEQPWVSHTHVGSPDATVLSASIDDRQFANLTPVLGGIRSRGHVPGQIRLRDFGDLRIQLEFAHVCGNVEYSKPPKPKETPADQKAEDAPDQDAKDDGDAKPPKPFVPKPIRPDASSNGRQAIEAAVNRVSWIKEGVFHGFHTEPTFDGVRRMMISLAVEGPDVVRLDELVGELRRAGFPPTKLVVSRRFSGIPFAKPLPDDVALTAADGQRHLLPALKQPDRPLALLFVSLNCKRHEKYKADPSFYGPLGKTIEKYRDRVDFVGVSANPDDQFDAVAEFWSKTGIPVRLLEDRDGMVRAVLNAQETPAPHLFVFDGDGRFRYAGDPHKNWEKPDEVEDDYLARALELVLAGKFEANGAVFFNKSLCNCSDPHCKCPKCGCGPSCRCAIGH